MKWPESLPLQTPSSSLPPPPGVLPFPLVPGLEGLHCCLFLESLSPVQDFHSWTLIRGREHICPCQCENTPDDWGRSLYTHPQTAPEPQTNPKMLVVRHQSVWAHMAYRTTKALGQLCRLLPDSPTIHLSEQHRETKPLWLLSLIWSLSPSLTSWVTLGNGLTSLNLRFFPCKMETVIFLHRMAVNTERNNER